MRRAVFVSDQIVRPSADTHNFRDTRSLKSNFFSGFWHFCRKTVHRLQQTAWNFVTCCWDTGRRAEGDGERSVDQGWSPAFVNPTLEVREWRHHCCCRNTTWTVTSAGLTVCSTSTRSRMRSPVPWRHRSLGSSPTATLTAAARPIRSSSGRPASSDCTDQSRSDCSTSRKVTNSRDSLLNWLVYLLCDVSVFMLLVGPQGAYEKFCFDNLQRFAFWKYSVDPAWPGLTLEKWTG